MKKLLRNLSVLCFVFATILTTGCKEEELPFLMVDHEVVLVGPETSKGTVVVESNVDWTASSDVTWITIDDGFGNHKGTFEFFVEANTTPNERSGKIKLDGGVVSVTILVRQQSEGSILTLSAEEISFTKDAGEYLMSIACNGDWKAASSADWCKVDPTSGNGNGSFKVTVEENNTGADRTAVISILTEADGKTEVRKIVVHQSASNAALVVSPESQELTAGASNFTLDVITTGNWEASTDSDWLTLSQTSGPGDADITVSATANDTGAPRVAVITFATGAENENRVIRQIVVKQAAVDFYLYVPVTDYPLSLDEQTIEIPYELEGSNVTVTASSSSKWMTVQSVADGIAVVKVDENKTAIAREGVISFITHGQEGDPIIRQVRVAQAPTINLLDVLADEYAVEWTGETFRIPIYSNTPVSVRSSESWCSATAEGQEIVISVPKNETAMPRVAVVTVTTESDAGEILSRTVIVRQAAAYSALVVTPETKNIYAVAQSFVANILTNNSWTASSDSDWLTIDKAAGEGDYMLTVTAAKNETGQVRVATITVQTGIENSQRESATITVTQRPEQFYFEVPVRSYLFGKDGGIANVPYVTSGNEESVTAAPNVDWLVVHEVEGGNVKVGVFENKTAEVRTGIVTITCTPVFGDPIAIPVTFTQSPTINILDVFVDVIDVMARGDEIALPYYANTEVSVSSSEDWCHAEVTVDEDSYHSLCCSYSDLQKIIKITVDPNRTGEARVAYVTISTVNDAGEKLTHVITVRQAALYAALSVTPKNVVIPAHNGHFNVVINTTGTWAASTTCTWLDSDYDSGEDDGAWAGFGDAEMFFEAGVNDTGAQREGDIVIATGPENNEREEQIVHVIQLERSTYIEIPISAYAVTKEAHTGRNSLVVGYYAAGDFKDMRVDCSEDWIDYSHSRSDREHLVFDIEENTTAEPRTVTVTVTLDLVVGEPISDTFTVTQAPTINILDVYADFYEASPWGETVVFPFYGNTEIGVSISSSVPGQPSWCSVAPGTPNQDIDPQELGIIVAKNETAEARTAYVTLTTVTDKGEKLTHIITIHQNPLNAALMVTPETVVLPSMAENAKFEMNIITSGTWTAATECTWLSPQSPATLTGTGDATIIWEASDNNTGVQREATITVWTGPENETRIEKIVKVIQLAYDTYLDIPQDSYLIGKEGFSGLDNTPYFEVACLMAGSIKDVVVDCGGADWIEWVDDPTQPVFGYLNFWVAPNDTAEPRTTTVTVTIEKVAGEPYTDSFTVTQAGTYNFLEGLSDYVSVKPVEDTIKLPVLTNVENLRAVASESWLKAKVTIDEDFDYAIVKIMAEANNTGKDREASITLITETDKGQILEKKIMVFQPAADTYFAILSGEELVVRKAGKNVTITAYASVNADKITMESNSPWVKLNNAGVVVSDDDEHIASGKFKVEENLTGEIRTAVVTVTFFTEAGEAVQKTVTITQLDKDGAEFVSLVDHLVVAAEGETVKLYFDTDDELTVNVSASWLNKTKFADPATSPQTLIVKAAENTTGKDRTAYITVSNGSESKLITVFQPAKDTHFAILSADIIYISPKKQAVDILAYATVNAEQVTAVSDVDWLTAKDPAASVEAPQVTAHFQAKKNDTGEERTANVKFNFKDESGAIVTKSVQVIQAAIEGVFSVPVDHIVLAAEGEFKDIAFLANEEVTPTSSSEWLDREVLSGNILRITAQPNDTGLDREGFVQLSNGKEIATIYVFQPAATTEFAVITPDIYVISGEKQTFKVTAYGSTVDNVEDIAIRPGADWLTGKEKVLNGKRVSRPIEAAANTTGEERSALVKVTYIDDAGATHEAEVLVIQEPAVEEPTIFEIPLDYLVMAAAGEVKNIAYLASDEISVISSSANWLTAKANDKRIRITAAPNTTGADREGYVQVSNGKQIAVITVFQPAAETEFALLSPDVIHIDAAAQDVNITAYGSSVDDKDDMSFRSDASWLTGKPKTINGQNVSRPFTAAENTAEEARTASILVTFIDEAGKTHTATVQIVQAGAKDDSVLEALVDYVEMDPAGETLKIGFLAKDAISSAMSSSSWLNVNYDADKSFVVLTAAANNTGRDRKAYVTVKNTKLTETIEVFQPTGETEFVALDPNIAVTSAKQQVKVAFWASEPITMGNISFVASEASLVANGGWVALSNGVDGSQIAAAYVDLEANTTGEPRTTTVRATWYDGNGKPHVAEVDVTQSPSDNILDVYVDKWIVPYLETEDRLPIFDNASNLVARSSNANWVYASIVTEADGRRDVKIKIAENTTGVERTGVVTITATFADGTTAEKIITILQLPKDTEGSATPAAANYLFLAIDDVTLPAEASTQTIKVFTSATDYTVTEDADWLTATKGSVVLAAEANTGAERTAVVTVTATYADGTTESKTMNVTQLAPEALIHYLNGPKEFIIDNDHTGGMLITLNTDALKDELSVTVPSEASSWLTVEPYEDAVLLVTPTENTALESREATVTVTATYAADGETADIEIKVIQSPAAEKYLYVQEVVYRKQIDAAVTEVPVFTNLTGLTFEVTEGAAWITIPTSSDAKFAVKTADNETGAARTGKIKVSKGDKSAEVIVKQAYGSEDPNYFAISSEVVIDQETTISFPVHTNAINLEATVPTSCDWLSSPLISQEGDNWIITFKPVADKYYTSDKQVNISVKATYQSGSPLTETKTVTVKRQKDDLPYLDMPLQYFVPAGKVTVSTYANTNGTLSLQSTPASWCTVTITGTDVRIQTEANPETTQRGTQFTLVSTLGGGAGVTTKTVTVIQLGRVEPAPLPGYIECNLGVVEKDAPAATVTVPFTTDAVSYVVTTEADWLAISGETPVAADHSANFTLNLDVNNGEKTRVGVVKVTATFEDNSTKNYYLPVIQHAYPNYFICPTLKYDLDSNGQFRVYIPAICNPDPAPVGSVKWKVDKTWVHLPEDGTASANTWHNFPRAENPMIFTINSHDSHNARSCNLTLQWTDPANPERIVEYIVVINQPGRP